VKETPPKQPSHNKLDNVEGEDWVVLEWRAYPMKRLLKQKVSP
jgi:hypothetical protein